MPLKEGSPPIPVGVAKTSTERPESPVGAGCPGAGALPEGGTVITGAPIVKPPEVE